MRGVDASLLAYGANRFAPEHARASAVLEHLTNGEHRWALPWSAVHDFFALVTHPHAVARPLHPRDAWAFVAELASSPSVTMLGATARHAAVAAEVIALMPAGSQWPPGFETAVLLREHGVRELLSSDRAMRRWPFLDVRDPVHGEAWTPGEAPTRRYRRLTRG